MAGVRGQAGSTARSELRGCSPLLSPAQPPVRGGCEAGGPQPAFHAVTASTAQGWAGAPGGRLFCDHTEPASELNSCVPTGHGQVCTGSFLHTGHWLILGTAQAAPAVCPGVACSPLQVIARAWAVPAMVPGSAPGCHWVFLTSQSWRPGAHSVY